MKQLLIIDPGSNVWESTFNLLVAATGEHLYSWVCSHSGFAKFDLVERNVEELTKRFGDFEVKFIDETLITSDELHERNDNWYKSWQTVKLQSTNP